MIDDYSFNTSVLVNDVSRQLFCALHERRGAALLITRAVSQDLPRALAARTTNAIVAGCAARNLDVPQADQGRLRKALEAAERKWLSQVAGRDPSGPGIQSITPSKDDERKMAALQESLTSVQFRGSPSPSESSDRRVICESLAHGLVPLVTGNLRTIPHHQVNKWAAQHLGSEQLMLHHPDQAMIGLTQGKPELLYPLALGILKSAESPSRQEIANGIQGITRRLRTAGMSAAAKFVQDGYDHDRDPVASYARHEPYRPEQTMLAEARRRTRIKEAVQDTGFGFGM